MNKEWKKYVHLPERILPESRTVRNIVEKSELEAAPAQPSALPRALNPSLDVSGPGVGFGEGRHPAAARARAAAAVAAGPIRLEPPLDAESWQHL